MIRRATPDDAAGIANAHVRAWEETYRGVLPDSSLDLMTYARRFDEWRKILDIPDVRTFVHESQTGIDGFASAHRDADEPGYDWYLSTLYVLRSAQRGGVSRRLLGALASDLRSEGARKMYLLTLRDRNPARAFYERMGATLLREQPAPRILGEGVMDVVYAFEDLRVLLP